MVKIECFIPEKYVGTVLSQKTYVENCLTHKQVKITVSCLCILLRIVGAISSKEVFEGVLRMKSFKPF